MAERLRLLVWTPSETLIEADEVEWVHVELRGERGLTVWPGHAPLIAETVADVMRYADEEGTHVVDLPAGIVQISADTVTVFLAGTPGEQAWSPGDRAERFDRLLGELIARMDGFADAPDMLSGWRRN